MDEVTISQFLTYIKDAGTLGVLIIILWSGAKGGWVWGWQYKQTCQDRDDWKEVAQSLSHTADRAAEVAEKIRASKRHSK